MRELVNVGMSEFIEVQIKPLLYAHSALQGQNDFRHSQIHFQKAAFLKPDKKSFYS